MRVSTTPWHAGALATGGYGRRIDDTSVSRDAPDMFHIPEVVNHNPVANLFSTEVDETRHMIHDESKGLMNNTVSKGAPEWFHVSRNLSKAQLNHTKTVGNLKVVMGKQLLCEPFPKRPGYHGNSEGASAIDWGSAR